MAAAICGSGAGLAQERGGANDKRAFAIEPQPLGQAIVSFSKAAGVDVIGDGGVVAGARSGRAVGVMTPDEALRRITAGTGARYRFTDATTVALGAPEVEPMQQETAVPLQEINVAGEGQGNGETATGPVDGYVATRSATGSKTDAPLIEIPQTINVVTADQMAAQSAQTVGEALRYSPGVRVEGYGAASLYDIYTQIRGFRAPLYLDGMRLPTGVADGVASSVIDPWTLERLEVLKGPGSGLYGQSPPGGLVNMVSKRPQATPHHEMQVEAGSFDRVQGAFDFGGPVGNSGEVFYRMIGLARDTGAQTDHTSDERVLLNPSVTWKPNDNTTLTVLGSYQRERSVWSYFNYLPAAGTIDKFNGRRISTHFYSGEPDFDRRRFEQGYVGYAFDHRFNEFLAVRQNLRIGKSDFNTRGVWSGPFPLEADGTMQRLAIGVQTDTTAFTVDNQAKLDFATGPFQHDAVVGLDYLREKVGYLFLLGDGPSINPFDPVYGAPVTMPTGVGQRLDSTLNQVGVYAQDQIKFGDGWIATLGGRYDHAEFRQSDTTDPTSPAKTARTDDAFTGRVGLTYLFDNGVAPYASYSTSFQPEIGKDSVTGTPFKPSEGEQYEIGVKYQPIGMKALFTVALFDLTQKNRLTFDNLFQQRQIGEVNVKGVEFEAKAELFEGANLIASYAYLDTEITKSANPAEVGFELFSVPKHQAALWGDYQFRTEPLAGLGIGAGVRYLGSTTDSSNTVHVPSVTLFDARLQYDLGKASQKLAGARLSLSVKNVFDKTYVSQCDGDTFCTYGNRRTVVAKLSYRW